MVEWISFCISLLFCVDVITTLNVQKQRPRTYYTTSALCVFMSYSYSYFT